MNKKNRTKEAFQLFHELNKDLDSEDYLELLERTFGKPPYEFIEPGQIPNRSVKSKKRIVLSKKEQEVRPGPNYFNFGKPEFKDSKGRLYKIADGDLKQRYVSEKEIKIVDFKKPDMYQQQSYGSQLFWIKLPSSLGEEREFPSVDANEKLELYHIRTGVRCTGSTEQLFIYKRYKTGHILIKNLIGHGLDSDPKRFEAIMNL